jgi:hypothetical protein
VAAEITKTSADPSASEGETMTTKTINYWDLDIRVRERNMKSGVLTDKDIERVKAGLPDMADQCDPVSLPQPALGGRDS